MFYCILSFKVKSTGIKARRADQGDRISIHQKDIRGGDKDKLLNGNFRLEFKFIFSFH